MWTEYKLAPISSFRLIQEKAEEAQEYKKFIIIIGSTGYGKTVGFNYYTKNESNTFYTKIRPLESSKAFFTRFPLELSGTIVNDTKIESAGSLDWLIQKSSFEFLDKSHNPLLIIDEAGNFKKAAQSCIRQVWDNISNRSGLIISGPDRYEINLKQWNRDLSSGIPELVSRVNEWVELPKPNYDDIELICLKNEIDDKKAINYIFNNSLNLRNVKNYVIAYHNDNLFN